MLTPDMNNFILWKWDVKFVRSSPGPFYTKNRVYTQVFLTQVNPLEIIDWLLKSLPSCFFFWWILFSVMENRDQQVRAGSCLTQRSHSFLSRDGRPVMLVQYWPLHCEVNQPFVRGINPFLHWQVMDWRLRLCHCGASSPWRLKPD